VENQLIKVFIEIRINLTHQFLFTTFLPIRQWSLKHNLLKNNQTKPKRIQNQIKISFKENIRHNKLDPWYKTIILTQYIHIINLIKCTLSISLMRLEHKAILMRLEQKIILMRLEHKIILMKLEHKIILIKLRQKIRIIKYVMFMV